MQTWTCSLGPFRVWWEAAGYVYPIFGPKPPRAGAAIGTELAPVADMAASEDEGDRQKLLEATVRSLRKGLGP